MVYMQEKIDEYLNFGVPTSGSLILVFAKAASAGIVEAASGVLETSDPEIRAPVAELLDVD